MVKANVIPGKFLSCLLGIFIGILLTLGGLVGGGFYAYKNVKVGSILGLFNQGNEWLSDEYAQNTIEGLVKELQSLANGDITLEKIAQISPAAGDKIDDVLENVNQNGIVTLDRDALYKTPINQLTSNLMDVVIITSTLDSLSETMNFALPDMPLITGGGQDKEVWVYTAVNDNETHTIDKAIALGDYTYYTRSSKYERVTEEKSRPSILFQALSRTKTDTSKRTANSSTRAPPCRGIRASPTAIPNSNGTANSSTRPTAKRIRF